MGGIFYVFLQTFMLYAVIGDALFNLLKLMFLRFLLWK